MTNRRPPAALRHNEAQQQPTTKATANPGGLFVCASDEWIGIGRLVALTSLSPASVGRLVDAGMFPPPLKRGRVRLWRMADVLMWVDAPAAYRVCRLPMAEDDEA